MRLKNIPKAKDIVRDHPLCIQTPEDYKGSWNTSFSNINPLFLEIGCGKGQFVSKKALLNPSNNYIGIEQYESVLYLALEKADEISSDNLRFLCVHAEYLEDYFGTGEVSGIYLNFSDPWPKKRHAKRRLTSNRFLPIYHNILRQDALIEMKTDNPDLYEFSLETFSESPFFKIIEHTDNLYEDTRLFAGNISTEYEDKFHRQGKPIHKIIAVHI